MYIIKYSLLSPIVDYKIISWNFEVLDISNEFSEQINNICSDWSFYFELDSYKTDIRVWSRYDMCVVLYSKDDLLKFKLTFGYDYDAEYIITG